MSCNSCNGGGSPRASVVALATVVALAFGAGGVGCAQLLGGLDEGRAGNDDAADAEVAEASADVTSNSPWLEGFAYRVAFEIRSGEAAPLVGFTTRLGLDTRTLVAAKKMRADGADIRVTGADATTVVPHWIQSGLNGEATTLWSKLDLAPGPNTVFLYYGNEGAPATSNLRATFVDGVIANASFDNGTSPWIAAPPTNGGESTLGIQDGRAAVMLARSAGATAESSVGWCQSVDFPAGHVYRLVFDATALLIDLGQVAIWTGSPGGRAIWTHPFGGHESGIDSDRIEAGPTQLCLGATLHGSPEPQAVSAEFQNVRLRLFAEHDPIAGPAGPEQVR